MFESPMNSLIMLSLPLLYSSDRAETNSCSLEKEYQAPTKLREVYHELCSGQPTTVLLISGNSGLTTDTPDNVTAEME